MHSVTFFTDSRQYCSSCTSCGGARGCAPRTDPGFAMRGYVGLPALILGVLLLSGCAATRSTAVGIRSSSGLTIEGSDPRLAAALMTQRVLPTAESDLRIAREYRRLRILDSTHAYLARALSRAPRYAAAHEEMARLWREWGFADKALGYAYRAVFYDPQSASAHNTLGTVLDALGRTDDARSEFVAALKLEPSSGWALNNLCALALKLGDLAVARGHCEAAVRAEPQLVAARNNLALTFAAAGQMNLAREAFLAGGDVAAAHYNVGIVHLAHREYLAAAEAFEQAIRARPTFTAAKTRAHDARMRLLTNR